MDSKTVAYSILELAVLPKGSSINQVYQNTVALAQQVEKLGYERMWFAEHHNMPAITSSAPDVLILIRSNLGLLAFGKFQDAVHSLMQRESSSTVSM